MARKCKDCGAVEWPPLLGCNTCGSTEMEWIEISGKGKMIQMVMPSPITQRPEMEDIRPYCLAAVEIEEGPAVNVMVRGVNRKNKNIVMEKMPVDVHATIIPRDGYDTVIGEGGSMLSGGQRQRIALARALLRDYPVIMLDEATSALDNETQATIREAIENMHGRRTVIMVAHRLSTVINCERLFYIENGRVLASGKHAELLEKCPEYRRLYAEEAGA